MAWHFERLRFILSTIFRYFNCETTARLIKSFWSLFVSFFTGHVLNVLIHVQNPIFFNSIMQLFSVIINL